MDDDFFNDFIRKNKVVYLFTLNLWSFTVIIINKWFFRSFIGKIYINTIIYNQNEIFPETTVNYFNNPFTFVVLQQVFI